jgi:trypsin-like peptidase
MKIRSVLLYTLGFLLGCYAAHKHIANNVRGQTFHDLSRAASGAVFLDQYDGGQRKFICSGTVIGHLGTDALFLTARHCVWEDASKGDWFEGPTTAHLLGPEEVSFTDNEQGPFYTAVPLALSSTDDVALLRLVNGGNLPAVPLGDERRLHNGEPLTNYTFALSFGKMDLNLKAVSPAFAHLPDDLIKEFPMWAHSMPVDGTVAPGSSGSGLFAPSQRALVGVAVGTVHYGGLNIAIPVSCVWTLLEHPETAMPASALITTKDAEAAAKGIQIPSDVFEQQFGEKHPFKLKVRGPSPEFIQGGYKFKVQSGGFSLYEPYYYNVPVFIAVDPTGGYRLTTTEKTHSSINVIVVSKAA